LPALQQRAEAGDPAAACRLVVAARRCVASADAYCAGVAPGDIPATDAVLQSVAPWLSPRQKTVIAMLRSDGLLSRLGAPDDAPIENIDTIYPQFLADHAQDFLQDGYRAHDALALEGLALVHAPNRLLRWRGVGPSLPNPRLFLLYAGVLQRVAPSELLPERVLVTIANSRRTLTPQQLDALDREIEVAVRQWNRSPGKSRPASGENAAYCED
jgi:hypothetical protein